MQQYMYMHQHTRIDSFHENEYQGGDGKLAETRPWRSRLRSLPKCSPGQRPSLRVQGPGPLGTREHAQAWHGRLGMPGPTKKIRGTFTSGDANSYVRLFHSPGTSFLSSVILLLVRCLFCEDAGNTGCGSAQQQPCCCLKAWGSLCRRCVPHRLQHTLDAMAADWPPILQQEPCQGRRLKCGRGCVRPFQSVALARIGIRYADTER
jgi:hypothetical protein